MYIFQHFPDGAANVSVGSRNIISSAFPNFKVPPNVSLSDRSLFDEDKTRQFGYLAYGGMFFGDLRKELGR